MPLDLIITRKETAAAMELSDIADICPAVLTETAAPETSGRYGFINTMQAMQILGDLWFPPYASHAETIAAKLPTSPLQCMP